MRNNMKGFRSNWCVNFLKCIKYGILLIPEYIYWFKWDIMKSSVVRNEKSDLTNLVVSSHVLEKGITMPERRLGFGYAIVRGLIRDCADGINKYTENHMEIQICLKDLEQYLRIHESADYRLPNDIVTGINTLLQDKLYDTKACYNTNRSEYFNRTADFSEFAHQRHSVRWYSDEKIDEDTIVRAIKLAQTAPSACNRQSIKVYVIDSEEKKQQVLKLQNGNRGFGHKADKILLITSDMKCWSYRSRSSAYLDAGIFTQNLLYALHYYNICACTLNASVDRKTRKKIQSIIGHDESEIAIVFISIGKAPDQFMVAGSQRINTQQICKFI